MSVYEELENHLKRVAVDSVPSEEYLRKLDVYHKYKRLGFRAKASRLSDELDEIGPTRSGNFLWTSLNLRSLRVWRHGIDHCNRPVSIYGVMLERFKEKRRALVLIPCSQWLGDIPEEVLDYALLNKHNFKSLYVAPVISGHVKKEYPDTHLITQDLTGLTLMQKIDPLLLGSYIEEIKGNGPANFAVLGVWGDDWFDLKLPRDSGKEDNR